MKNGHLFRKALLSGPQSLDPLYLYLGKIIVVYSAEDDKKATSCVMGTCLCNCNPSPSASRLSFSLLLARAQICSQPSPESVQALSDIMTPQENEIDLSVILHNLSYLMFYQFIDVHLGNPK